MRFLHFATNDIIGGAAKATYRLHGALRDAGHDSRMIVRNRMSDDAAVRQARLSLRHSGFRRIFWRVSLFRKLFLPKPSYIFNLDLQPEIDMDVLRGIGRPDVDAVCLHWITELLSVEAIARIHAHFRRPLLWVLMDIEPITGGCHYAFGCTGYMRGCGTCPLLGSTRPGDLSRRNWLRKRAHLHGLPITFIAPTSWVERRIRESSLFGEHRVERIPLAVDTSVFRPGDPAAARDALGIPREKKILFFGTSLHKDPRKGMSFLAESLRVLAARLKRDEGSPGVDRVVLLVAGETSGDWLDALPFRRIEMGYIDDDAKLALAYQASDLFACPSIEDAGPMMIPESMLCGTPVAAFDTGGAPDLIRTGETGFLAKYRDSGDLAEGILALLSARNAGEMREAAWAAARRLHAPDVVVARYVELCTELSEGGP